jgi:hypothetical protein
MGIVRFRGLAQYENSQAGRRRFDPGRPLQLFSTKVQIVPAVLKLQSSVDRFELAKRI